MKSSFLLCLGFLVSFAPITTVKADEAKPVVSKERPKPNPAVQQTFELLLDCIQNDSYSSFLVAVDNDFKVALTEKVFKSVVTQVAPRMKKGFQPIYLEELKRQEYKSHLWKLIFEDGGDDMLVTLSIKDSKVGGLLLQ